MPAHENWLAIAKEDLLAAKGLLKLGLFSSALFHCQQSVEKSLKAYLTFKKHPISKTHDLVHLLELCMSFDPEFKKVYEAADYINPFATRFRYPTEFDIPDIDVTKKAIKLAENTVKYVLKKIEMPIAGQMKI